MPEAISEREGSLLKSIREWVPYLNVRSGDELEVVHGPLKNPITTVGVCDVRVRSVKDTGSITGLMVGEMLLTPQARIQSMRVISRKETANDI